MSFQILRFYEEDDVKLAKIAQDYRSGKLLSGELKQIVIEKLSSFVEDIQKKREKVNIEKYFD